MNSVQARQRLVIGNWKMNGSLADNAKLLEGVHLGAASVSNCLVGVCVPFPYLAQAQVLLGEGPVSWGAQDVSEHESGAYTAEVSAAMLNDFACRWVLAGHSERRTHHGENNDQVARKARSALQAGLTPVVCVGETLQEQEAGNTADIIVAQLAPVLALGGQAVASMVIAYEPVWAIGTGRTASPRQAQDVHALIRNALQGIGAGQVQVLYGGSVKAANAASLFAMPDIDGALVGGASLVAEEFLRIAAA